MVGQTCRFAATTRRSSPTFSEIYFGNCSNRLSGGETKGAVQRSLSIPLEKRFT